MAVFNRYSRRPQQQQPADDEMKQVAAQRMAPMAAIPPADDGFSDIARTQLGAPRQPAAPSAAASAFGNVDQSGRQNFSSGPARPTPPPTAAGPSGLAGQAAPRAGDTSASSQIRQGIGVATGQGPTGTIDPNAQGQLAPAGGGVGGSQAAPNGANVTHPTNGQPTAAEDGMNDVARQRLEHEQERAAREADLRAAKAEALQNAGATAGLMGLGLTGATTALQGDIARTQERGITEDLANLDRQQRDEDFQGIQRQAAIDELEADEDVDLNGDGLVAGEATGKNGVGDGNPDNNKDPSGKPGKSDKGFDKEPNFAGDRPKRHNIDGTALNPADYTETGSVHPPIDHYEGSDAHYDYYTSSLDGKKWKVPRAKAGSPGIRA